MSSPAFPLESRSSWLGAPNAGWVIALLGWAAIYLPVYWWAGNTIWQSDEHAHGPIVLAVLVWLLWGLRESLAQSPDEMQSGWGWGWPVLAFGLLLYVLGQVLNFSIFLFASQTFVLAGALLLLKGTRALRLAWFPIFYTIFMIPLPGVLVDAITGPLKQWISAIVENILYGVGYPIARTGVVIVVGQYQMLVADACSGLNSMFSLSALGTVFMYLMARKSVLHNAIMLASILPIAFASNIIRVIILVLITYHFGDEAGQGFLHGAAGMVLMLVALVIFFLLDALLAWVLGARRKPAATA
ncbi:MAG: exosortase B [Methylibium sp.]|uniref:exosortase B n=1 Tax=Methylibium sp. TaxID=2067992 RepID=UPI001827216F|nr:exosortase B [Methylibium sp.]MBA3597210.1 exosortase B [Methylibium sp.]